MVLAGLQGGDRGILVHGEEEKRGEQAEGRTVHDLLLKAALGQECRGSCRQGYGGPGNQQEEVPLWLMGSGGAPPPPGPQELKGTALPLQTLLASLAEGLKWAFRCGSHPTPAP